MPFEKAMLIRKYRRQIVLDEHSHGFMRPFTCHQIITWIVFAFNLMVESAIIVPVFSASECSFI